MQCSSSNTLTVLTREGQIKRVKIALLLMSDLEDLLSRHRKELKDLTGKVTALKKSIGKGAADKKKV